MEVEVVGSTVDVVDDVWVVLAVVVAGSVEVLVLVVVVVAGSVVTLVLDDMVLAVVAGSVEVLVVVEVVAIMDEDVVVAEEHMAMAEHPGSSQSTRPLKSLSTPSLQALAEFSGPAGYTSLALVTHLLFCTKQKGLQFSHSSTLTESHPQL